MNMLLRMAGVLLLGAVMFAGPVPAASAAPGKADAEFAALEQLRDRLPPWQVRKSDGSVEKVREPGEKEAILWNSRHARDLMQTALAFHDTHPDDPRRWEAFLMASRSMNTFIMDVDEKLLKTDPANAVKYDVAARDAWRARKDELEAALLAATDVPAETYAEVAANAVYEDAMLLGRTMREKVREMKATIDAIEKRAPQSKALAFAYTHYLQVLARLDEQQHHAVLEQLKDSGNERVARIANGLLNRQEAAQKPLEMKFTAIDGREVDLAGLRGKVVLIDFWATWCGPCKAEIPNIERVHETYRAKGFEVVGISLDRAEDRQKVLDYVHKEQLPWPQHFDGKGWENEFARRFGIHGIPAMFLLDRSGRVVSTDARGANLEPAVKRHLGP